MSRNSPSVMRIFDEMDSETEADGLGRNNGDFSREGWGAFFAEEDLQFLEEPKSCDEAIKSALAAEKDWKDSSLQLRADTLHKAWELLVGVTRSHALLKDKFSLLTDYLDFYCNVLLRVEEYKGWRPQGVTVMVSSSHSELFPFAATIPAALAAGCAVVVVAPEKIQALILFLQDVFLKSGYTELSPFLTPISLLELKSTYKAFLFRVPRGVFSVVADSNEVIIESSMMRRVNKAFFCGPYLQAQKLYKNSLVESFNFFCPNNAAAFVLESADLGSAVDKIISETWGKEEPFFAVSTVVVQESVYQEFFEALKFKMNQHMTKHKHSAKFKDEALAEKMKNTISEALLAGASVHECETDSGHWGPTVITNFQSQDLNQDTPLLRLLPCRTAKEGVALLNNCRYTLGTSVWCEISSQALEISSRLISPNVWVNCHGVCAASVPLQLSGFSGNCVLGGGDGILEFLSLRSTPSLQLSEAAEGVQANADKSTDWGKVLEVAASAHQAFRTWQSCKVRRQLLKAVATSLQPDADLHQLVQYYAHAQGTASVSPTMPSGEFFFVKERIPNGVILLLINSNLINKKLIVSLITSAVSLGNALIIVFKENNSLVQCLTQTFTKTLPKGLVSVILGMQLGIHLISHANIQAVWLYNECSLSADFLQAVKSYSTGSMKRFWIVPEDTPGLQHFSEKECLQSKVVWLPKIDEFP